MGAAQELQVRLELLVKSAAFSLPDFLTASDDPPSQSDWNDFMMGARGRLRGIVEKLKNGTAPRAVIEETYAELLKMHTAAQVLGRQAAGALHAVDHVDAEVATYHMQGQGAFLAGFLADLEDHDPRYFDAETEGWRDGPINVRLQMYASRLRGTAGIAFEANSPNDAEFLWKLGASEHCADCIDIASRNPWRKGELSAFPGDGSTACKVNCHCSLERVDGAKCFTPDPGVAAWQKAPPIEVPADEGDLAELVEEAEKLEEAAQHYLEMSSDEDHAKAMEWLKAKAESVNDTLTGDEKAALGAYVRSSSDVNAVLRGDAAKYGLTQDRIDKAAEQAHVIGGVLHRSTIDTPLITYRGMHDDWSYLLDAKPGDPFVAPDFVSTSMSVGQAFQFCGVFKHEGENTRLMLKLRVPAGAMGVPLGGISQLNDWSLQDENEVLLADMSTMTVVGLEKSSRLGVVLYILEVEVSQ